MQVLVSTLLSTLLLAPVVVVLTQSGSGEVCPDGRDKLEFQKAVIDAACNYSRSVRNSFWRDTRSRHGEPDKGKYNSSYLDL